MVWQFLLDNNCHFFPLDISKIARNNGWKILSFQECNLPVSRCSEVSFGKNDIIILYDLNLSKSERRFFICHEIAHIVLFHYKFNKKSKLIYEQEAEMFACRLLVPICLLYKYDLKTIQEIENLCQVPLWVAKQRLERANRIKERNKFLFNYLERRLYDKLVI